MSHKVLVVDDETDIHELLKYYLGKIKGVEVISAYSGEEAIKIYDEMMKKNDKPSLVIMDLNLSGTDDISSIESHREGMDGKLDGVRTARKILDMDRNAVIWGYTAWFGTDWAESLKKLGIEKMLEKPTPFSDFAKMVEKFLKEK